jgi:hypothetical protein
MFKLTIFVVALSLFLAGPALAGNTITKKAAEYAVDITIDKNPPVVGKNNVDVGVKDKAGSAVTDAKVVVEISMAAMPGMPAANYKSTAQLSGDKYKAVIQPSMKGPWGLAVKITRAGKTDTARTTIDVR